MFHFLAQHLHGLFPLRFRAFDDQLVVHLQYEPCLHALGAKPLIHVHHGELYNVRRRALNRHVERDALAERAQRRNVQLRQIAPPVEERFGIAERPGAPDGFLLVISHAAEAREIGVHIFLRLAVADADVLREREGGNAVHYAEVHGLRSPALLGGDVLKRHAEYL